MSDYVYAWTNEEVRQIKDWYKKRCALWKQAAKKWYSGEGAEEIYYQGINVGIDLSRYKDRALDAEALAAHRLELLRRVEEDMHRCPICLQLLLPVGEHDGFCKLAAELKGD